LTAEYRIAVSCLETAGYFSHLLLASLTVFLFRKTTWCFFHTHDSRKIGQPLPVWCMGAAFDWAGWWACLMPHNQFINDVSAVHTTASRSRERLTGSY